MGGQISTTHPASKYAKIVMDDGPSLPSDIPSFKVLIHEQLAQSASNSIEGSTLLAQEISKSLVVDLLRSKENTKKFGVLLGDIFKFDSILEPTRSLIYWSIQTDASMSALGNMSAAGLGQFLLQPTTIKLTNSMFSNYLRDDYFISHISKPYFTWLLTDRDYCIHPLVALAEYHMRTQKDEIHAAVKDAILVGLKAETTRYALYFGFFCTFISL